MIFVLQILYYLVTKPYTIFPNPNQLHNYNLQLLSLNLSIIYCSHRALNSNADFKEPYKTKKKSTKNSLPTFIKIS